MRTTRKARKRLARKKSNHTGRYIMVALMSTGGGTCGLLGSGIGAGNDDK